MRARQHRTPRRWAVAGVPLLLTGLMIGALTFAPGPSSQASATPRPAAALVAAPAAPAAAVAAPTTVKKGKRTVTVDPPTDIGASEAAVTVTGKGFDTDDDLWVAICQADGTAPKELSACLGGPIPDNNATTSWAVVTDDAGDVPPGPVPAKWSGDGFSLTLQVAADNDGADCATKKCAVYVRSAGDSRGQDVTVPIAFAAPATSSPATTSPSTSSAATSTSASTSSSAATSTPTTPTTSSSPGPVATTVPAQSVLLKEVAQGREQVAVFTGFQPEEVAAVTLSGNLVKLPNVKADPSGAVRVAWTVPKDFPVGGYTLRTEGRTSLRVGEAGFTVIAAAQPSTASAATSSAPPSTSASPSTVASSTAASSTVASSTAASTTVASSTRSASSSAATSSSVIGTPAPDDKSGTPWWLWITLAAILLVGLVVAAVAMGRRHREESDAERAQREAELAAAAQAEAMRHPQQPPGSAAPAPGFDEHPDRPILFSHRQAENYAPPTEVIGDPNAPTRAIGSPGAPGQPKPNQQGGGRHSAAENPGNRPSQDGMEMTSGFDPFADDVPRVPPTGPGTQKFDPFADEAEPPTGTPEADEPGGPDQWRPPNR